MRITSLQGLEEREERRILIVIGEAVDRERAEAMLTGNAQEVVVLQGEGLAPTRLDQELSTRSLLGDQTIVVRAVDKLNAAAATVLEQEAPFARLIMVASSLRASHPLYKSAELVVAIPAPKPWEKARLLQQQLMQQVQIEGKAAEFLIQRVGPDQALLLQEVEKLEIYAGERPITVADVAALAVGSPHESIWELGGALLRRQGEPALRIFRDLVGQGMASIALLATIRGQFQRALTIASMEAHGLGQGAIAKRFPQMRERQLHKTLQEGRGYGVEPLQRALLAIATTELRLKNESVAEGPLMESLLVRLAA